MSNLKFHKTQVCEEDQHAKPCQNHGALDISGATARLTQTFLKALAILSNAIVRGSEVDQEDLKPCWK